MRLAVLLLLATLLAPAARASHIPDPPQGGCFDDGHGQVRCVDPPRCYPPGVLDPVTGSCELPPPTPPALECRILVRYAVTAPAQARVDAPALACDRAGMELALAAVLARLLGAPLP